MAAAGGGVGMTGFLIAGAVVTVVVSLALMAGAAFTTKFVYVPLVPLAWLIYLKFAEVFAPGRLEEGWAATRAWAAGSDVSPTTALSLSVLCLALTIVLTSPRR